MNLGRATLLIETPELVHFRVPLAGPYTRFLALLIDFFAIIILASMLSSVSGIFTAFSEDLAVGLVTLLTAGIGIFYGVLFEWFWRGQTPGKRVMRIRVMDEKGLGLRFSQILIRNLLRPVDMLPLLYLVGGISVFFSRHGQRLGDLLAGTVVVSRMTTVHPNLTAILSGTFNSFRNYPHLVARLRKQTSPAEADLALQALLRRQTLDPTARVAVYHDLAVLFQSIVPFPNDAVTGLSDEQYIMNIVDVLYQTSPGRDSATQNGTERKF